jgi:hypothetical protein
MASTHPWIGLVVTAGNGDCRLFVGQSIDSLDCFAISFLMINFVSLFDFAAIAYRLGWGVAAICLWGPLA